MESSCCSSRSFIIPVLPLDGRVKECTSVTPNAEIMCSSCETRAIFDIFMSVLVHFASVNEVFINLLFKHCFICINLFLNVKSELARLILLKLYVTTQRPSEGKRPAKDTSVQCFVCEINLVDCLSLS